MKRKPQPPPMPRDWLTVVVVGDRPPLPKQNVCHCGARQTDPLNDRGECEACAEVHEKK